MTIALTCAMTMTGAIAAQAQISVPSISDRTEAAAAPEPRGKDAPMADSSAGFLDPGSDPVNVLFRPFFGHLAADQRQFWTRPLHLKKPDVFQTVLPFAGFTGLLLAGDSWFAKQVPAGASQLKRSKDVSDYAAYALIASAAGAYAFGHLTHNDRMSETGFLAGEAALNSTLVAYAFKQATRRERPYQTNGHGDFLRSGSSFPSEHAAIAWSVASVVAHEYPGTLTQIAAYGLASAVSLTRVTAKRHFPSDVLVGSALGWYFGRQVYRAHHDPELGGEGWGDLLEKKSDAPRSPSNMGSPYVPLDSWIYPALERLAALGYVRSAYLGIRPWTRMECARQVEEAAGHMQDDGTGGAGEPGKLYAALAEELAGETARLGGAANLGADVDSIYWRTSGISGAPLRDGFHFGQTLVNDFGRPYGEGVSAVGGFTGHAVAGPLAIAIQGEFQHAPAVPSDPASVLAATAAIDVTQPLANSTAQLDRFRLLAGTVSLTFNNLQFSFGQQNLWLGPGEAGPLLASDNAEPMTMIRIDSVSPYEIPLISNLLGPVRSQFFLARLSGQRWEYSPNQNGPNLASQPYLHGTQLSFHPTANLEVGMGFTAQFGGTGNPFTWGHFLRTFYSHKVGIANNPGKRLSEFNFTYRLPGLRTWAQVYMDAMVIDEYSPVGSSRPAINPGIYFPRLPKLPHMDLRLEGVTTDLNVPGHFGPGAFYWDDRYRSGYTNNGNPIGSWVGRRGRGEQAWLTYRFSPRTAMQMGYRHNNVDRAFLGGGQQRDLSLRADLTLARQLTVSAFLQREDWNFPVLSVTSKSNGAASLQLTWWPGHKVLESAAR